MVTERDEGALIAAAQAGDVAAFSELARRHQDRLYGLARRIVGNAEDAKDVTQNVLLRLWRTLARYDSRYSFATWSYRVTVNLAIDHLRRSAPRRRETALDERIAVASPGSPAQEAAASWHEVQRIFDELGMALPPQQKAVFVLKEIEGLTSEEVGELLGLSGSTVRNHLFQARRTLRQELARRYPEYLPRSGGAGDGGGRTR